ncbi:hypothetical protein V6N13_009353 [Hibiscus sabdariffa]|uniref:Uncharacterized protein n=1 Tax=Hibiscus sabdariffa TaxID=183260 RepID=A0ABR2PNM3_9ROSI
MHAFNAWQELYSPVCNRQDLASSRWRGCPHQCMCPPVHQSVCHAGNALTSCRTSPPRGSMAMGQNLAFCKWRCCLGVINSISSSELPMLETLVPQTKPP